MNKNIIFLSVLISFSFMTLSFFLRLIYYNNIISLIVQPLIILFSWFFLSMVFFSFLRRDFQEVYIHFVFFDKMNENENLNKINKKFNLKEGEIDNFLDIYDNDGALDKHDGSKTGSLTDLDDASDEKDFKNKLDGNNKTVLDNLNNYDNNSMENKELSKKISNYNPKQIANVVKKFLNENKQI